MAETVPYNERGYTQDGALFAYNIPPGGGGTTTQPAPKPPTSSTTPIASAPPTVPTPSSLDTFKYTGPNADSVNFYLDQVRKERAGTSVGTVTPYAPPTVTPPTTTKPALNDVIASSAPEVQKEDDLKKLIDGMTANRDAQDARLKASYDQIYGVIDAEKERLERQRSSQISDINAQFEGAKRTTLDAQGREVGTFNSTLSRIGGYLGKSASSLGALENLAVTHRAEIASLEAKRAAAINAANDAVDEKQFKLASDKAKEIKSLETEIEARRNTFFDQSLSLITERRQQEEFEVTAEEKIQDNARGSIKLLLDTFGGIDYPSLSPAAQQMLANLAARAGVPLSSLYGPSIEQAKLTNKEQQDAIENMIKMENLKIDQARLGIDRDKAARDAAKDKADKLISVTDAQRLGLPKSLVGLTQDQIGAQLSSGIIPDWFIEAKLTQNAINEFTSDEEVAKLWEAFRTETLVESGTFNFGALGALPTIE
jgi:hypothetical protein